MERADIHRRSLSDAEKESLHQTTSKLARLKPS
jgi:hypothetical protein